MTLVSIDLRYPIFGKPAERRIGFIPTMRRNVTEGDEDWVELPAEASVALVNGKASVELAPTVDGLWAWTSKEYTDAGEERLLGVPDQEQINYGDLPEIDPESLNPLAPLLPIWKQYIDTAIDDVYDKGESDARFQPIGGGPGTVDWDDVADKPTLFPPSAHSHSQSDVTGLAGALGNKANSADVYDKTTSDGRYATTTQGAKADSAVQPAALTSKADLVDGVVPTSQIPSIAMTSGQAVANRAAMLALTNVQPGDFVSITTGADKGTYVLSDSGPSSSFSSWLPLSVPTDVVQTVNGQQGVVVLGAADVGAPPVTRTVAGKPLSADVSLAPADITGLTAALGGKAGTVDIQTFNVGTSTWTKPAGAKVVHVQLVSGGAGGGSGRRWASPAQRGGGGGGGSGAFTERLIPASILNATETVVVGAGGAGGASAAADNTDGQAGTNGNQSTFGSSARGYAIARAGVGGGAGTSTAGTAGGAGAGFPNGGGSAGGAGGANAAAAGGGGSLFAGGGGGGGGITTADALTAAGTGGYAMTANGGVTNIAVGATPIGSPAGVINGAQGGPGGSASTTAAAIPGTDGAFPGGGGGGGGASANGFASGAGGKGGDGFVIVTTYF